MLLGFSDLRILGVPASLIKEPKNSGPQLREKEVHNGEEGEHHGDLDGDGDGQAVEGGMTVELRDVEHELNACRLEEGSLVYWVRDMEG